MSIATTRQPSLAKVPPDFNCASFLSSLPPEFVSSLPLDVLFGNSRVVPVFGKIFLAYGGDKAAMRELRFPKKLLKIARRERTKAQWLAAGKAFTERSDEIGNSILIDTILAKVERLCVELVEKKVSNQAAFSDLPSDILGALDSLTECLAAIVSLAVISATVGLRGMPWESSKDLSTAIKRLKDSKGDLRERLTSLSGEFVAAHDQPIKVGSATYPSAHHAVFGMASNALETISLARTPCGGKLYLETLDVPRDDPTSYSDCVPVAAGLFKLAMPHFASLLSMAQQESCRAAQARQNRNSLPQPQTVHNSIHVGTMNNSTIQQGSPGATQVVLFTAEDRKVVDEILSRLADFISDLPLSIADMEELGADIEAIKTQIQTANPKQSIVKACLGSIRSSLEVISAKAVANGVGMATSALAGKVELVRRISEFLGQWSG